MMFLLDVVIRSSLVLLAGLGATALLRRRSAALRHAVLATALFAAAVVVPLSRAVPAWTVQLASSAPEQPAARPQEVRPDAAVVTAIAETEAPSPSPAASIVPFVQMVWLMGAIASIALLVTGLGRLAWLASRARHADDERWERIGREVAAGYGLARPVTVLFTHASDLIATWGLLRPRLLLPAHARHWSDDRIHIVLRHELAHVRRGDWIVQMAADALRSLYWFNPLLWIACTRLRRESEQASDDAVLETGVPAREYAAHLLEIARTYRRSGPKWAPAMPMARPSTLERRIAAMLNPGLNRSALSARTVVFLGLTALCVTLPVAAFRAAQTSPMPLVGTVYDPTGAVMPGVALTLEDEQEFKWQATSDASGRFEFPPVRAGKYKLQAELPGFRPLRHDFELKNTRDWDRAITLQVGQLSETVHVSASRVASQSPQPAGPARVRVGGNVKAPRSVRRVNPTYPASMREAGREGVVPIEAIIGPDGLVASARVLSAQVHPDFGSAALEAVRQWEFTPTLLNGVPVEVVMTVSIEFSLTD
jgi:TonB family protein